MKKIKSKDFIKGEYCDFETKIDLWDQHEIYFSIDFELEDNGDKKEALNEYLFAINSKLDWINENKKLFQEASIRDGIKELAEDWVTDEDVILIENNKEVFNVDGHKVIVPIEDEDFCKNLCLDSFGINITEIKYGEYKIDITIYVRFVPDYFAGHVIEVVIDTNNNIKVNGLAG